MNKQIIILVNIIILLSTNFIFPKGDILLSADSLNALKTNFPTTQLHFKAGDDSTWANPNFDHSNWQIVDTRFSEKAPDVDWNGTGWFRMNLLVDSTLVNKEIGIFLYSTGELKLFLNGELLFTTNKLNRFPNRIVFKKPGNNTIAIRFSNNDWKYLKSNESWAGFIIRLVDYDKTVERVLHSNKIRLIKVLFFLIPALILAILHFFIYLFDKRAKQNLYYVFFLLSFALFVMVTHSWQFVSYQTTVMFTNRFGPLALNFVLLWGAFTVFSIFNYKLKFSKIFIAIATVLGIIGIITAGHSYSYYLSFVYISFICSKVGRIIFRSNENFTLEKKIIRIGFGILSISGIYQMFLSFDLVWTIFGSKSIFLFGVLTFLFSMSLALAKEFVTTRNNLEEQLIQVKKLSKKTLEQELASKELETKKRFLEIENKRKSKELDDTRKLQLSMLPNQIPQSDDFEISAYLATATEVGGDYYDFLQSEDGSLIIAIGDATGHGTKAGLMVAIIKGLFKSLVEKLNIPEFFNKSTEIIKDMKLGNLFMSLLILRIQNRKITTSAAGMPPILVYRSKENTVESITIKGMPVGAHKNFPYGTSEFTVETDDVILVLSDGLPELFNKNKEMYDYNKVNSKLLELGKLDANNIINGFVDSINNWRENRIPDDDITLMVIKFK